MRQIITRLLPISSQNKAALQHLGSLFHELIPLKELNSHTLSGVLLGMFLALLVLVIGSEELAGAVLSIGYLYFPVTLCGLEISSLCLYHLLQSTFSSYDSVLHKKINGHISYWYEQVLATLPIFYGFLLLAAAYYFKHGNLIGNLYILVVAIGMPIIYLSPKLAVLLYKNKLNISY